MLRSWHAQIAAVVVALAATASARADEPAFTKGPYLQDLRSRSVQIRWETARETGGIVRLTGPEGPPRELPATSSQRYHAVDVPDLEPAVSYSYVVTAGGVPSAEGHFTTAPEDGRPFTFLAYGDNRSDETAHTAVVRAMLRTPSDFLIHTGDMVLEGDDETAWQGFFQVETPLLRDRCVFACVGNHELIGKGMPSFLRYFQAGITAPRSLHASMRWGSARFFFLNAMATWGDGEERGWLEAELTRADTEPGIEHRFVVLHHGPFSSGPHAGNLPMNRVGTLALMKQHKVDLVFAGHDHIYERGQKEGIRYLITGGGGAPLYKARRAVPAATEVVESVHHFVEVKVDGPRVVTIARRLDGTAMDTCTLVTGGGWTCETTLPAAHQPGEPIAPDDGPGPKKCGCEVPGGGRDGGSMWVALVVLASACVRRSLPRGRKLT